MCQKNNVFYSTLTSWCTSSNVLRDCHDEFFTTVITWRHRFVIFSFQKLLVDEKNCYHFGRNPTLNDFCTDHSSCSRIHAALVYHKHLSRFFLVDLGSTHGTFIGSIRLESYKPTQLPAGSKFHFGASTREYILREKPKSLAPASNTDTSKAVETDGTSDSKDLPEDQIELDHLTEFNTANNKRISVLGIANIDLPHLPSKRSRPSKSVTFKEEEDIINPEDVDPTVGKFRNLVQSAVIPSACKKKKLSDDPYSFYSIDPSASTSSSTKIAFHITRPDHSDAVKSDEDFNPLISKSLSLRLGIQLPNPTPDIEETENARSTGHSDSGTGEKKKRYVTESWPRRNPALWGCYCCYSHDENDH